MRFVLQLLIEYDSEILCLFRCGRMSGSERQVNRTEVYFGYISGLKGEELHGLGRMLYIKSSHTLGAAPWYETTCETGPVGSTRVLTRWLYCNTVNCYHRLCCPVSVASVVHQDVIWHFKLYSMFFPPVLRLSQQLFGFSCVALVWCPFYTIYYIIYISLAHCVPSISCNI